ncbi:MAG: alpha/beta fold hydrolase [Gammaproteobacteria bacterium]|nr:alpha/beta fold hydrolase [Gammaproteobacteria bacterium]
MSLRIIAFSLVALIGLNACQTVEHRNQTIAIPIAGTTEKLAATVVYPPGTGPFPLAILNHGTPASRAKRAELGYWLKPVPIDALVARGFAVLVPIRRGFGATGGEYRAGIGSCSDPEFYLSSLNASEDIAAAISYASQLPSVDASRILLLGHSAGGIASMAAASAAPAGVKAVVNFSGGRGSGRSSSAVGVPCYPERMAEAIGSYAATIKVPVLWYYVENDTFFGPAVVRSWYEAFTRSGGTGTLVIDPAYGNEGHYVLMAQGGDKQWGPALDAFLVQVGFPLN